MLYTECAETTQLDAVTTRHGRDDFAKYSVRDVIDIALIQVRIPSGNFLDEFGLDHRFAASLPALI